MHHLRNDLDKILVSEDQIKTRIIELGREISDAYRNLGEDEAVAVIAITNGAIVFTADLIRHLEVNMELDCVRVSSYRDSATSDQEPEIIDHVRLNLQDRHVLLIDDILDTGSTLAKVVDSLNKLGPRSIRTSVLLDKKARRTVQFNADFVGFYIPDEFVVGYGLDFAERYRHLPCIGVLKPELQNPPTWT